MNSLVQITIVLTALLLVENTDARKGRALGFGGGFSEASETDHEIVGSVLAESLHFFMHPFYTYARPQFSCDITYK
ncbi:Hypothetical predicted protein, partial [Paramuricea clavata]